MKNKEHKVILEELILVIRNDFIHCIIPTHIGQYASSSLLYYKHF